MSTQHGDNRRRDALLAATGAIWAGFVLPPVVVAWDRSDAPAWARRIARGQPYDWIRSVADRLGAPGDYEVFGVLVAPALSSSASRYCLERGSPGVGLPCWLG